MKHCCENKAPEIQAMRAKHSRVLWSVLVINAAMFFIEGGAGILAHSTSLLADALDMLGDALVYGFSLFVLSRSRQWQAAAAISKGVFMMVFGIGVLAEAIYKMVVPVMPNTHVMGGIGLLALIANLACFWLLYQHRDNNINMRSTWLCSRNDLLANLGVLLAAALGSIWLSRWPDIIVGLAIVALFLRSSWSVLQEAIKAWHFSGH